jgi:photosystem II stability/assembly factor-like uncharacterized protein
MIVAGSDLSGAYRSRDRGASWEPIGAARGLAQTHVNSVAFDPADARILYLGAEDALYRSADGGDTFRPVLPSVFVSAIAPAPSAPAMVYAGCASAYKALDAQVYQSTDRGVGWRRMSANLPGGLRILKLVVDPAEPRRVYLLSGPDLFSRGVAQTLHRSADGGVTWRRMALDLGAISDMDLDPGAPQVLYVTADGPKGSQGVYRSADGGDTWQLKAAHGGAVLVQPGRPAIVRVVEVGREPSDRKSGVWESRDGGESWSRKSSPRGWETGWQTAAWALSPSRYGLAKTLGRDLSRPEAIYWADAQFVLGSFDGGSTFSNLFTREVSPGWWRGRGIDNVAVLALAIGEAGAHPVFAGSLDLGLWRSLDGGGSWQSCNEPAYTGAWRGRGGNTAAIVVDPVRTGTVWATMGEAVDRATLVRSERSGAPGSWSECARGLPRGFLTGLSLDRASPPGRRTLFVTANGDVYRSTDDGGSWSRVLGSGTCRATAVERNGGRVVYCGGERGLWRSSRGGEPGSWLGVGTPEMKGEGARRPRDFQWEGVHAIVPDPSRPGRVYVTAYGEGRGLYRSDDRGATWTKLRACDTARALAVDPANPNLIYFTSSAACRAGGAAQGSEGILRSEDGGRTWVSIADGLPWPFGGPIVLDPADPRRILLGSPGTGFLTRTLPMRGGGTPGSSSSSGR